MNVTLTWHELEMAAFVGMRRQFESLKRGYQDTGQTARRDGLYNQNWGEHVLGASGEMAFAKARGLFWDGSVNTLSAPDVADIQVRTRSNPAWDLIIAPRAKPEEVYVLVVPVKLPLQFRLVGWIRARDAMREEWRKSYGGHAAQFCVPQSALHPITPREESADAPS